MESSDTAIKDGIVQSDKEKVMKAPGRNEELIAREPFENDPKGYFHGLRGKGNKNYIKNYFKCLFLLIKNPKSCVCS